jgi:hypothetical protein
MNLTVSSRRGPSPYLLQQHQTTVLSVRTMHLSLEKLTMLDDDLWDIWSNYDSDREALRELKNAVPRLTRDNYLEWAPRMRHYLEFCALWDHVKPGRRTTKRRMTQRNDR